MTILFSNRAHKQQLDLQQNAERSIFIIIIMFFLLFENSSKYTSSWQQQCRQKRPE